MLSCISADRLKSGITLKGRPLTEQTLKIYWKDSFGIRKCLTVFSPFLKHFCGTTADCRMRDRHKKKI